MSSQPTPRKANTKLLQRAQAIVRNLFASPVPRPTRSFKGRGIVVCGGGYRYFTNAWILIKMLRKLGCNLSVQLWYLGPEELDARLKRILVGLEVECVDAGPLGIKGSHRGWSLKAAAMARSSFEEVLYLDADNCAVQEPSFLFDIPQYKKAGTLFWPDTSVDSESNPLLKAFQLPFVDEPKVETGQMLINKNLCWKSLASVEGLNTYSDIFYQLTYGGKDLFRFAWRKCGQAYPMPESPPQMLTVPDARGEATDAALCQHDFEGNRLFQHRMLCKWDLLGENPWVTGFFFESQCRKFLEELKSRWNGRIGPTPRASQGLRAHKKSLVGSTWLLEVPIPLLEKPLWDKLHETDAILDDHLPHFVKAPSDVGKLHINGPKTAIARKHLKAARQPRPEFVLRELTFASDGTIATGSGVEVGYFWDLQMASKKPKLSLFSDNGKVLDFRRTNGNSWAGRYTQFLEGKNVRLRTLPDVYPHAGSRSRSTRTAHKSLVQAVGAKMRLKCSSGDISDHIIATYVGAGLSRSGVQVTFHTSFASWLSRISEPGLTIINSEPPKDCHDLNDHLDGCLRYGKAKASWQAGTIHPSLKPVTPKMNLKGATQRFPFNRYIILSPYSVAKNRDRYWPDAHWTRLANLIRNEGYEIIAIGLQEQAPSLLRVFSQTQVYWAVGHPPDWIMDALLGASAYIGIDNETTQLAALLQVKSIVIHSQTPASFLWPKSAVHSLTPNMGCTFCRWQPERGYFASCESACSALAAISPDTVVKSLSGLLS